MGAKSSCLTSDIRQTCSLKPGKSGPYVWLHCMACPAFLQSGFHWLLRKSFFLIGIFLDDRVAL